MDKHAVNNMMEMKMCRTQGCNAWMMKPANQTFICSKCNTDEPLVNVVSINKAAEDARRETVSFLVDLLLHVQDQGQVVGKSDCGKYLVSMVP